METGRERPDDGATRGGSGEGESLAEVLASIRALVSAETEARLTGTPEGETVLMLTPEMRVDAARARATSWPTASRRTARRRRRRTSTRRRSAR